MTAAPAERRALDLEALGRTARELLAASTAPETEVSIDLEVDAFARFAARGPTQAGDRERLVVSVRARVPAPGGGYAEARARAVGADPAGWRRALERAHELARVSPVDAEAPALGGPVDVPAHEADHGTLRHDFAAKAAWIDDALAACGEHGLAPAGLARTGGRARVLVNSAGRHVAGATSRASFALTAVGADGDGLGVAARGAVEQLDVQAAVQRAVAKARLAQAPRPLAPGDYPVVLEPLAVSSALLFASYRGFGAREVDEGESFLCGRQGERVLAADLTVVDDAAEPLAPGLRFDGEGSPRRRTVLVEGGVLRGPVTDARYAAKLGLPCSGHARPQPSDHGPSADNLVVLPGGVDDEELLGRIDRGLLVTQFHYTNVIDPRELLLTGMTRNGTFWVEGGEVRHAVRDLRFTDSAVRFFGAVLGVGRRQEVAGALFDGQVVTPSVALPSLRFTSGGTGA